MTPGTATMQYQTEPATIRRVAECSGSVNVTAFLPLCAHVTDGVDVVADSGGGGRGVGGDAEVELGGGFVVMDEENVEVAVAVEICEHGAAVLERWAIGLCETGVFGDVLKLECGGRAGVE